MLGDIVSGKTATADVFFLIAVIVFVIGTLAYLVDNARAIRFAPVLVAIGLAFVALGFLVL